MRLELGEVSYPALTRLLRILQEFVREEISHAPALLGVLDKALGDEVLEGRAPFCWDAFDRLVDHSIEQQLQVFRPIMERRIALGQFECEAPVRPDVHLRRISVSLGYLRRDPARCTFLRMSVLLLLSQEDTEAQIGNLDIAVWTNQDVIRFNISMNNVLRMHGLQAQRHLV